MSGMRQKAVEIRKMLLLVLLNTSKKMLGTHHQVILHCDFYRGQNCNIKMALTLVRFVQDPRAAVKTIDLKFMVSGHSF